MLVSSLELRRLHTDEHTKDSKSSELGCVLLAAVCITEWPSARVVLRFGFASFFHVLRSTAFLRALELLLNAEVLRVPKSSEVEPLVCTVDTGPSQWALMCPGSRAKGMNIGAGRNSI